MRILRARVPQAGARLAGEIARFMQALRRRRLSKAPGVAETIDWAQALLRLDRDRLDLETVEQTLGCVLKDHHDLHDLGGGELEAALAAALAEVPPLPAARPEAAAP